MTGVLLMTVFALNIIYDSDLMIDDMDLTCKTHALVGLAIFVWILAQFSTGVFQCCKTNSTDAEPITLTFLRKIHRFSGYTLVILGKYNVLMGWRVQQSVLGFTLTFVVMILSLSILINFVKKYNKTDKIDATFYLMKSMSMKDANLKLLFLM